LKAKVVAMAIAIGMLPILAVGTTIYHFGNQSINKQITEANREGEGNSMPKAIRFNGVA